MKRSRFLPYLLAIPNSLALAVSGFRHLDNPYLFLSHIYSYDLVGEATGVFVAAILPPLQLTLAIALFFDASGRRAAFLMTALLFAVFLSAQILALSRGLEISCGCFGTSDKPIGPPSIALAAGGLTTSVLGFFVSRGKLISGGMAP
jgi:hypothetical protein